MTDDTYNDENQNAIDDAEEATIGMTEVDNFDFERAVMLMGVMEKVANVGVKSTAIGGLAAAALNEMNEEAKAIARRRAEEFAKAEAKAQAKLAEPDHSKPVVAPRAIPSRPVVPTQTQGGAEVPRRV